MGFALHQVYVRSCALSDVALIAAFQSCDSLPIALVVRVVYSVGSVCVCVFACSQDSDRYVLRRNSNIQFLCYFAATCYSDERILQYGCCYHTIYIMVSNYCLYLYFIHFWFTTGSWKNASGVLEKSLNFFITRRVRSPNVRSSTDDGHQFITPIVHVCRTRLTTLTTVDVPRRNLSRRGYAQHTCTSTNRHATARCLYATARLQGCFQCWRRRLTANYDIDEQQQHSLPRTFRTVTYPAKVKKSANRHQLPMTALHSEEGDRIGRVRPSVRVHSNF